jgi:hypothetical protein
LFQSATRTRHSSLYISETQYVFLFSASPTPVWLILLEMRTGTGPALAIGGRKGENRGHIWQRGHAHACIVLGDDHEKAESLSQVSRGRVPGDGAGVFPHGPWLAYVPPIKPRPRGVSGSPGSASVRPSDTLFQKTRTRHVASRARCSAPSVNWAIEMTSRCSCSTAMRFEYD